MKVLLLSLVLLIAPAFAQTVPSTSPAPVPALPSYWVGTGVSVTGTPMKATGWGSFAKSVGQKNYSYSTYDVSMVQGKLTASLRTGIATVVYQKPLTKFDLSVLSMATAGMATNSSILSTFSGGGLVVLQPKNQPWTFEGIYRLQSVGGVTQKVFEIGFGRTFDKF